MGKRFIDERCSSGYRSSELAARIAAHPERARDVKSRARKASRHLQKALLAWEVAGAQDEEGWQPVLKTRKLHSARSVEREFL